MAGSMTVVGWSGPYTFKQATSLDAPGIYLCWGRNRFGKTPSSPKLLYCGISEDARGVGARIKAHEGKDYDHASNHWWVGRVRLPARSTRRELEAAEWMVVRFTGTEHNQKKTLSEPKTHCYLVSEWYRRSDKARYHHRGVAAAVPDVLGWDPDARHLRFADSLRLSNE